MRDFFTSPIIFLKKSINKGHERSVKAKQNILSSLIIKAVSILISLVLVPLTINYVNPTQYGIWLTLSSIVGWFSFFDIGLTQGLRNKFAEAKAKGDDSLAQIYISTTYAILGIVFGAVWGFFLIANHFLNWASILNISQALQSEMSMLAIIVFSYFCLQFVLRIVTTLLTADQQPAKSSFIDLCGQILSLVFIAILVKTTRGSLIKLGLGLCVSPILILFAANVFYFQGTFKKYRPKFSKIKFSYSKNLFNLGIAFFIIQIASVVQYESANIIIARNFGTSEVTSFNIVYKYFGVMSMVYMIFISPFWSASTDAFLKNDFAWIKNSIKKYNLLNIGMVIIGFIMLALSAEMYRLWLGKGTVKIDFSLSFWGFIFFNVGMFGTKYVNFLNGINALRIQLITSIISPFLYIAISLILISYFNMGVYSLFIAATIANVNAFLIAPLQYYKIIIQGKRGIWIR